METARDEYFHATNTFSKIHAVSLKTNRLAANRVVNATGLTMQEWRILADIVFNAPCTASQVATETGIHQSHLSANIGGLIKKELITREPSSRDKRAKLLQPTEAGRSLVDRVLPDAITIVEEVWRRTPGVNKEELGAALASIEAALDEMLAVTDDDG